MKIFDAHFHIIDPRFPLVPNQGYLPPSYTCEDYQQQQSTLKIKGGAIVSGSFQAFDQSYLLNALQKLGPSFVGVANIPRDLPDEELDQLDQAGVVAVRFNLKRGGSAQLNEMSYLANRLFKGWGWHTELYLDSKVLQEIEPILKTLPKFSIDHLGLTDTDLLSLYDWVEKGVRVKATGFGRINFDPIPIMKKIYQINPSALVFGTDLPSTRARVPFSSQDIERINDHFSSAEQAAIYWQNAYDWYFSTK